MHACMYACMHACMYVCMYVCMYLCKEDHYEYATKVELLQPGSISNCVLQLIVSKMGLSYASHVGKLI